MRFKAKPTGSSGGSRLRLAVLFATVAAFLLVPAAAQANTEGVETLKINITGTGAGKVFSAAPTAVEGSPPMNCTYASPGPQAGTCENQMTDVGGEYEQVLLSARAAVGSEFVEWKEENGEFESCNILNHETAGCGPYVEPSGTFGETTELGAVFNKEAGELLTLNIEAGKGAVVSSPAGLDKECNSSIEQPRVCWKSYAANTKVTLTASPAVGYLFKSWKGCDKTEGEFGVNGRQCTVKMSQAKTVGASFIPAYKLTASKAGSGMLTTAPAGVNCGYTCTSAAALYKEGALTVKEKPNKHFHFVEFKNGTGSAEACNGVTTETCLISTFNSESAIEAKFAEDSKYTLNYSLNPFKPSGGQGAVTTKPAGINCGYTCTASSATFYNAEGEIEVKVKLNKGTTSVKWTTGAGTGNCENGKTVSLAEFTCKVPAGTTALVAEYQ